MVKRTTYLLFTAFICIFTLNALAASTAVARLDRTMITMNETVQLTVSLNENTLFGGPDISAIEKDFDVLGSHKSSQSSWINGEKSATTTWVYELSPKQPGVFTIPAIDVDGTKTEPLGIQVKPANDNPNSPAGSEPVFIEVFTDKSSIHVQEQLLLTIRINSSVNLTDLQLEDIGIENAFVKKINETNYPRDINGAPHITYEVIFAIFPQTSGKLSIPAASATAILLTQGGSRGFGNIFNRGKTVRARGVPLEITVNEAPAAMSDSNWLPAKGLQLHESWSSDPTSIQLGDSITRTITTTAVGLGAEQLPPVEIVTSSNIKTYPDQPVFEDKTSDQGITGIRKDSIALVATKPGQITLPEITVEWWDITTHSRKTARLPEITLTVVGDANAPASATAAMPPADEPSITLPEEQPAATSDQSTAITETVLPWQIATATASALALLFLGLYIHAIKKNREKTETTATPATGLPTAESCLKELKKACDSRNTASIRSAILNWARLAWPDTAIHSTFDVAKKFDDNAFTQRIKKLDAILYSGEQTLENWQGLYEQVEKKQQEMNPTGEKRLAPLYPAR